MKYSVDFPNGSNLYSIDNLNNNTNTINYFYNNSPTSNSNTDTELYGNFKPNFMNQPDLQPMSNITSYSMNGDQSLGGMDSNKLRWNQPPLTNTTGYPQQPQQHDNTNTSTSENSTCNNSPVSQSTSYMGNQNINQSSSPNVSSNNILNSSNNSSSSLIINNTLPSTSPNVLSAPNKKRQRDDEINTSNNNNSYIDPFALRDDKDFNQSTNSNLDNTNLQQNFNNSNINDSTKEINIKIKKDNTTSNIQQTATTQASNTTTANTANNKNQQTSGNLKLPSIHHLEFEVDRNAKKDDNSSGNNTSSNNTNTTNTVNNSSTNTTNTANTSNPNNTSNQSSSSPNNQKKRKTKPSKYSITPTNPLTPTSSSTNSSIGASPISSSSNIPFNVQSTLSSNSLQSYMNPTDYSSMVSTYHSPTSSSTTSSSVTSPLINQYGTNPTAHPLSNQFYSSLAGAQTNDTSYFQSSVILSPFQKSHNPTNPLSSYGSTGDLNDYMSLNSSYYGNNTGSGMNTPQGMGHSPSHDYSSNPTTMAKNQYDSTSSLSLLSSLGDNNLNKSHTTNYYSSALASTTPSSTSTNQTTLTSNSNTTNKLTTTTTGHIKYEPNSSTNYHDQISQSHLYQNNFTYYDQSFPHPPVKKTHRRRPANIDKSTLYCHNCGTKNTPEWRRGPSGPATLCNACGLAYAKKQREEETNLHKLLLHSNSYSYHRGNMLESYVTPSLLPLFNTAASVPYMSTSNNNQNNTTAAATTHQTAYTNSYNIPNTAAATNTYTNSSFKPLTFSSLKTPNERNLNSTNTTNTNKTNYTLNGSI
ncbi:hypothetical protein DICPUDRAFT_96721 [Dictyostelium purpureum]|uniref:GATA-type domain-containing protein n=1 Tax=Dictyostelium purpureum TaxID=5786 RepID=F0ZAP6_DICPU|nr:uncharacterized protein DICPUDRAFT_96721 [Dictyostelium purpureum]EGC38925.1 hypothetical protein DICPUDRAFT_96721 [Dictyostelium purpureum]|eukprot:XP_003284490.1 hypothetical protein DICPUDRAFT_96721 [Dictyostelium purpureum]